MSLQAAWIRSNMLGNGELWHERQPTEAELKVQRSLQKLSIPEWYLNKSSKPPKILSNNTPIESRPPSWKTGTYKVERQVEIKKKIPARKNTPPKGKVDTSQKPKFSQNISKTFPRLSPSRKIQNINIVFPQLKNTKISSENAADDSDKENVPVKTPKKEITFQNVGTPFTTPTNEFKIRAVSTPRGSPVSLFSVSALNASVTKENEAPLDATFTTVTSKNSNENLNVTYDFGKYDNSIDEDKALSAGTPVSKFFNSKTKSRTLEHIVKSKISKKKSLIQEIIDEFNQKCLLGKNIETSPENLQYMTYRKSETGQKKFVQNLVTALETKDGKIGGKEDERSDEDEGRSSGSETDIKSAASSISLSFKDSDSDSDRSPSQNVFANINEEAKNDEDDSVYWIPVPRCKLPRTSSLLSMMSRLSVNSQISPCMSPINMSYQDTVKSHVSTWGKTYKKTSKSAHLFRIEESAHTDSGYCGSSVMNSIESPPSTATNSRSSWFDELEEFEQRLTML